MGYKHQIPIFDGHNDTLKSMYIAKRNFFKCNNVGHLDLPRSRRTGLKAGFFAIFTIPESVEERAFGYGLSISEDGWEVTYPRPLRQSYAERFTNDILDYFVEVSHGSDQVELIRDFKQLTRCMNQDILSIITHFEGAEAIQEDLSNLEYYYEMGLRSLGLVWSRPNAFASGVPFKFPSGPDIGPGLTLKGKELVRKCNELGIIIDLAHINLNGFFDVAELSNAPLIVSHAGVHSICPSSTNLLDSQLEAIKASNGVVGVIFDVLNTRPDGKFIIDTPLNVITEHIDYIASKIGIDHVAFGSDFDGGQLPAELNDVTGIPKIIKHLQDAGYKHDDIEKIAYRNWMRVIEDTWK